MEEEKVITNLMDTQAKRVYIKPVVNKVQLVAEEAVLALCKQNNGIKAICDPTPACVAFTQSS